MKKVIALLFLFLAPLFMWAQDDDDDDDEGPGYMMVELNFMTPKIGSEKAFVEAVKKHNDKWHKEGPHQSFMWYIRSGEGAGSFVWGMGPMIFSDLDNAPGEGDHMADWAKNVAPHVASYGAVENWVLAKEWSYSDGESNDKQIVWIMDIDEKKRDQFKAFMKKVGKVHQEAEKEFHAWSGSFTESGHDYALVIPFDNYSWFDANDWDIEEAFDEMYGEDAWEMGMEMMDEIVKHQTEAIWERVK